MATTGSRKPEKALTAAEVRNAGPGKHFDGHGLFLRVQPNGARQWVSASSSGGSGASWGSAVRR